MNATIKRLIGLAVVVAALLLPSTALARDRDHDHMRDSWEHKYGLSTKKANGHRDRDHDGLVERRRSSARTPTRPTLTPTTTASVTTTRTAITTASTTATRCAITRDSTTATRMTTA